MQNDATYTNDALKKNVVVLHMKQLFYAMFYKR